MNHARILLYWLCWNVFSGDCIFSLDWILLWDKVRWKSDVAYMVFDQYKYATSSKWTSNCVFIIIHLTPNYTMLPHYWYFRTCVTSVTSATHLANISSFLLEAYFANRKPFVIHIATLQLKLPCYMRSVMPFNSRIKFQILTPLAPFTNMV